VSTALRLFPPPPGLQLLPTPGWVLLRVFQREPAGTGLILLPWRPSTHPTQARFCALNCYGGMYLVATALLSSATGQ